MAGEHMGSLKHILITFYFIQSLGQVGHRGDMRDAAADNLLCLHLLWVSCNCNSTSKSWLVQSLLFSVQLFCLNLFWVSYNSASKSWLVQSLMFSVQLFLCLYTLFPPGCPAGWSDRESWQVTWSYISIFLLFFLARRGSCCPASVATSSHMESLIPCLV